MCCSREVCRLANVQSMYMCMATYAHARIHLVDYMTEFLDKAGIKRRRESRLD